MTGIDQKQSHTYDVILIGSGPASLIEARYFARKGKLVAIIDKDKTIGGAWKTFDYGNVENIDYGCHIFNPFPRAYSFLKSSYGINMVKTEPQPVRIIPRFRAIIDAKSIMLYYYILLNIIIDSVGYLFQLKFKSFFFKILNFASQSKELFKRIYELPNKKNVDYLYPKGGASEFVDKLGEKAIEAGVTIILDTDIQTIVIKNNTCTLSSSSGEFKTNKLIISSGTVINNFYVGTQSYDNRYSPRKFLHLYVHLKEYKKSLSEFSYIYVQNHKFIGRMNNITSYVDDKVNGSTTTKVMVLLTEDTEIDDINLKDVNEIISLLQKYNYISNDTKLLEYKKYNYVVNYMDENTLQYYKNASGGVIDYIYTAGLSESIQRNSDRWL